MNWRRISRIAAINFFVIAALFITAEIILRSTMSPIEKVVRINYDDFDPYFINDPADPNYWITNPSLAGPEFDPMRQDFSDNRLIMRQRFNNSIPENTFRIIVIGASPIYGSSLPSWYNLSTQLALRLYQARPDVRFEIIETSREDIGADEYEYAAIQTSPFEANLVVCYPGGAVPTLGTAGIDAEADEFAGDSPLLHLLIKSELFRLIVGFFQPGPGEEAPGHELPNRPDQFDLQTARMIEQVKLSEIENYRKFLIRIFEQFQKAERRVVLMTTATNFSDFSPIWSLHSKPLSKTQLQSYAAALQKAKTDLSAGRLSEAQTAVTEAISISDSYAEAHFILGKIHEAFGRFEEAKSEFIFSRENDFSHERIFAEPTALLKSVGREYSFHIIDSEELLAKTTTEGLVGKVFFRDHTHLTVLGLAILTKHLSNYIIENLELPAVSSARPAPPNLPAYSWSNEKYGLFLKGRRDFHMPEPGMPPTSQPPKP
jgi:tetratricopeptide (TPR) repeat protein